MDRLAAKDPVVYSSFYRSNALYHQKRENFEGFYSDILQYLAYTNEKILEDQEKVDLSLQMALAVLLSDKIYNFSELVDQPILLSLHQSPYTWVFELIKTFNEGSVSKFYANAKSFAEHMKAQFGGKEKFLEEKIRVMALLELVFRMPKNERTVSFKTIAEVTQLNVQDVELLIMKAMSLDLIRGSIDEIDQTVQIRWSKPKVVDKEKIKVMRDKLVDWSTSLNALVKSFETSQQQSV
eukprot:TRINITY_DN1174_c0_g1_i3.p1 TRINITY_DN1174_c0_g1~~TRINITY_DN1174_c0_g1_i3.p1  ORF type:complete len:238 (+),score=77.87 TRINITY_DN1174_c0_g1_i3:640-1353(+)